MNKKAFTLIELLVVISIIALLLSILMPSLSLAKQHAEFVVCKSKMRNSGNAIQMFAGDNDGRIYMKFYYLYPYYGYEKDNNNARDFLQEFKGVLSCDVALKRNPSVNGNNQTFAANRSIRWDDRPDYSDHLIKRLTDPVSSSETIMHVCAGWKHTAQEGNEYYMPFVDGYLNYTPGFYHFGQEWVSLVELFGLPPGDHRETYIDGKQGVMFFDTHIEGMMLKNWPNTQNNLIFGEDTQVNYNMFWFGGLK